LSGLPNIDPTQTDTRANDTQAKRELFLEANDLLNEKGVFMLAVRALRIRWYGEFLDATERDKERDLKAKLKVLDAVPAEIKRFVSDYSMALDRQAKNARRP
jgi:5-carboxymethyl-2-hydroxymuconate isomerase